MFCSQCGKRIPDDAVYCGFCGAPTNPAVTPDNRDIPTPPPMYQQQNQQQGTTGSQMNDTINQFAGQATTAAKEFAKDPKKMRMLPGLLAIVGAFLSFVFMFISIIRYISALGFGYGGAYIGMEIRYFILQNIVVVAMAVIVYLYDEKDKATKKTMGTIVLIAGIVLAGIALLLAFVGLVFGQLGFLSFLGNINAIPLSSIMLVLRNASWYSFGRVILYLFEDLLLILSRGGAVALCAYWGYKAMQDK